MTDPFDALRLPPTPLAPDPEFTAQLRSRLVRALAEGDDPGGTMTTTDTASTSTASSNARPTGGPTLSPYLMVSDARRAFAWYADIFDGEQGDTVEMDDGRLGHAEIRIGGSTLMLADEFPETGMLAPTSTGATTVSIHVEVPDVDATTRRAADAGATVEREPADAPYGFRGSAVLDPFGHRWLIQTPLTAGAGAGADGSTSTPRPHDEEPVTRPGDIVYVTWAVRDEQRAAAFFGELLGWTFSPGHVDRGLQMHGANVLGGLMGGVEEPSAKLMYHVTDIQAGAQQVRDLGGTATEPELQPYGWSSECTDDQGMEFWIYTPADA